MAGGAFAFYKLGGAQKLSAWSEKRAEAAEALSERHRAEDVDHLRDRADRRNRLQRED